MRNVIAGTNAGFDMEKMESLLREAYKASSLTDAMGPIAQMRDMLAVCRASAAAAPDVGPVPVPMHAIGRILGEVMQTACDNGANSISIPNEYVAVAHFLAYPERHYLAESTTSKMDEIVERARSSDIQNMTHFDKSMSQAEIIERFVPVAPHSRNRDECVDDVHEEIATMIETALITNQKRYKTGNVAYELDQLAARVRKMGKTTASASARRNKQENCVADQQFNDDTPLKVFDYVAKRAIADMEAMLSVVRQSPLHKSSFTTNGFAEASKRILTQLTSEIDRTDGPFVADALAVKARRADSVDDTAFKGDA